MSEHDDSRPPVDPVKKQTFLMIVQTAIAAAAAGKPVSAASEMGRAIEASERIPTSLSASEAADEFVAFAFAPPKDAFAPKWTGILTAAEFEATLEAEEMLIGDEWYVEAPRWLGLPGDSVQYLDMLSFMRDRGTATFQEILGGVAGTTRQELADMLHDAETTVRMVERSSTDNGPVWRATSRLILTQPRASEVAKVARRGGFRLPLDEDDLGPRLEVSHQTPPKVERPKPDPLAKPDAKIIMSELRGDKQLAVRDLNKQLPHLDRTAVLRHLKRLRDAGHVQIVGEGRNALWRLKSKAHKTPAKVKPRSPAATTGPKMRPGFKFIGTDELAAVERFVAANPGRRIGEIAKALRFENVDRARNVAEKLYGGRRLHRRHGRHYPGKDPDWE